MPVGNGWPQQNMRFCSRENHLSYPLFPCLRRPSWQTRIDVRGYAKICCSAGHSRRFAHASLEVGPRISLASLNRARWWEEMVAFPLRDYRVRTHTEISSVLTGIWELRAGIRSHGNLAVCFFCLVCVLLRRISLSQESGLFWIYLLRSYG